MKAWIKLGSVLLALSVAACGGGGDGGSSGTPSAQSGVVDAAAVGAYGGTISGGPPTSTSFLTLILEDGSYWTMYGWQASGVLQVTGFMQGTTAGINNGTYSSVDARDFGYSPSVAASVSGSYVAGTSLSGKVLYNGGITTTFNGSAIPSTAYAYNTAAQISAIAGAWTITLVSGANSDSANINISNAGVIGAGTSTRGCSFSGSVAPRASGKNVYDVTLTFGAAPCLLSGQSVKGVAVSFPLSSGQHQLLALLMDSSRTNGIRASGVR